MNCGGMWEGGEVARCGAACTRSFYQLNVIKIDVGIVIGSRVAISGWSQFVYIRSQIPT
jgi:hypothetical protein